MLSKNTGIINKCISVLFLCITSVLTDTLKTYNKVEAGGSISISTFNHSMNALLMENAGFNFTPFLNISFYGEQHFRNKSVACSYYTGPEFRFNKTNFQIPLGINFGIKTLHIGSFSQLINIMGINSGFYYGLSSHIQLRTIYRGKLYFDNIVVWGNDFLLGLCFTFISEPTKIGQE